MKICPFCAEEVQDMAIKCRFCGEWFVEDKKIPLQEARQEVKSELIVIGVGNCGINIVNHYVQSQKKDTETLAIDTNPKDLSSSRSLDSILIGEKFNVGVGTGTNLEFGRIAAEASIEEIKQAISGANIIFIVCGLGGLTGTGATPFIVEIAKSLGIFVIGVAIMPFTFEGQQRMKRAVDGLEELKKFVDILFIYENDRVIGLMGKSVPLIKSFELTSDGILDIINLIKESGLGELSKITLPRQIKDVNIGNINKDQLYDSLFGDKFGKEQGKYQGGLGGAIDLDIPAFMRNK